MSSTKFYKQSVFDHASLSISMFSIEEETTNSKLNKSFLNYIRQTFEYINLIPPNNSPDYNKLRKVFFNFKFEFSLKEKEWENFQAHRRPYGLLCISEFKSGNSLKNIIDIYILEKEKISSSTYESRLIFIYDEKTELISKQIRKSLNANDEILSSVDSETGEVIQTELSSKDFTEEMGYIQDAFVQNEIIWCHKLLISTAQVDSNNSLGDSTSSCNSAAWKISSLSSESLVPNSIVNSPQKSSLSENSFDVEIRKFLLRIFEKLYTSLSNREITLTNKIEQTRARHANSEGGSDTGSVVSLEDGESNLLDPIEQDNKKFQEENRFIKGNRSRQYLGRSYKHTADQSLLCGNYVESYFYYQLAICYLKKVNDQLWLAGAEEGLCCSWIAYNFTTPSQSLDPQLIISLHEKSRQLFLNQSKSDQMSSSFLSSNSTTNSSDQTDFIFLKKFVFNDIFKNPPELQNIDELNEKYHNCISRYKKILKNKLHDLYPIHLDSIIKASRFFIDQHRFLEAANFLKMIKSDLLQIHNDMEQYHNTLSHLYSQMGFFRKSALHKYKKFVLIQTRINTMKNVNRQQSNEEKKRVLIEILNDLNVKTNELFNEKINSDWIRLISDDLNSDRRAAGFQSIKMKVVLELFHVCRLLKSPTNMILGLGLSLLDSWHMYISSKDLERLIEDLDILSKSGQNKDHGTNRSASVANLPKLTKVLLTKLPEYLLPKQPSNVTDDHSVFIYTPLKTVSRFGRPLPPEPIIWICGEECEIVLQFDNPISVPLQLVGVTFLLSNTENNVQTWVPSEGSSIHYLPAHTKKIHCHFVVVPNWQNICVGNYRIVNVSYQLSSIYNIIFYPHKLILDYILQLTVTPEIKLYPMMPQLRIISSISEQADQTMFKLCNRPGTTVVFSNLTLYENEMFEFYLFLSNESKELDIEQVVCELDELDLNISSNTLISRFADQEFSNRKCSSHRLLSFSQAGLEKCLPIKSISSLKDVTEVNSENPTLPTEAILKFRVDTTNKEFCRELFHKSSINSIGNLDPFWRGQLKITVQYWSRCNNSIDDLPLTSDVDDVVFVRKENPLLLNTYRESVCLLNCQLIAGLGLINYQIDNQLNLVLTLMNFTEYKLSVEIFWKDVKLHQNHITIASKYDRFNQISKSNSNSHRNSSTELYSHLNHQIISSDKLQLKELMKSNLINSSAELATYIQSNMKISWIMNDAILDKRRQGYVNLTWCNCYFSQMNWQNCPFANISIGHELTFSINDFIRIWMSNNVNLEMTLTASDHPDSPTLPDNTGETIHIFEGAHYHILCEFKEKWPHFLPEQLLSTINLVPVVDPTKMSTHSLSSFEIDNRKLKPFVFAGNSVLSLHKNSMPITEMNGFILFLVPGSYSVACKLTVANAGCHKWQSDFLVLSESNKYHVHVV